MMLEQALAARLDAAPLPEVNAAEPLLRCIGAVAGQRALLLGRGGVDVMCDLIRAGASEVTDLCHADRPKPASADLVVVPDLAAADQAPGLVAHAKRALATAGRIVVRSQPIRPDGSPEASTVCCDCMVSPRCGAAGPVCRPW
jgi:hypothetical protein